MLKLSRLLATRIVSTPAALDGMVVSDDHIILRTAADEALILPPTELEVADDYAIIVADGGNAGIWLDSDEATHFLARTCEWEIPNERPVLAQGMVAGVVTKLWLEEDRVLLIVPAPYAVEMEERLTRNTSIPAGADVTSQ